VRLALLASLLLLLPACGSTPSAGDTAPAAESTPDPALDATPWGTSVGMRAPNFELPVLSGGEGRLSLEDLRGKVVLMTFWASWCGPCRQEVPALERHWKKLRDQDVVILGISIDETEKAAGGFLDMFPVTYPMILDPAGGMVADVWGVSSIPATILLDKNGVVRNRHLGYSPTMLANTMREISELLQE